MPSKNKPKRLDRNRKWRVARRKRKRTDLIKGTSRSRAKRPKKKKETSIEKIVKNEVKKATKKTVKKVVKKIIKK